MIGVGREGMEVGNLDNSENCEEDNAHHRSHRESSRCGATVEPFCLKSCQKHFPLIQDTHDWMREAEKPTTRLGRRRRDLESVAHKLAAKSV
jgi:hypothetical protein